MNLTPLRELEPTPDEIARVLDRARPAPAPRRRRRAPLAVAAVAAATAVAFALPSTPSATSALRTAAAAAAQQPAPAEFTGYRYVEMLDLRRSPWATYDESCASDIPPAGSGRPFDCPVTARAEYTEEGRQEIWVDAEWKGTRRDHGSKVTGASGDPELSAALRREMGREPATTAYVYGEGPFARAPLAQLPTDPDELLRTLSAAYADNRWGEGGTLATTDPARQNFALATFTAHLLAEANATPALRSAAFGMLARMRGFRDLGAVRDPRGREGHGIEVRGRSNVPGGGAATLKVIFDPERGELLSWGEWNEQGFVERVLLTARHVRSKP
jgi:hypothetical protein